MSSKLRFVSVFLVASLIVIAGSVVLMPKVSAQPAYLVQFSSQQDNLATTNLGTMQFGPPVNMLVGLPFGQIFGAISCSLTYNPVAGYFFVSWQTTGGVSVNNPNAQSTTLTIDGPGTVTAVYKLPGSVAPAAVGGVILPTSTLAILAPYLALIGLVAASGVAVAVRRRREV